MNLHSGNCGATVLLLLLLLLLLLSQYFFSVMHSSLKWLSMHQKSFSYNSLQRFRWEEEDNIPNRGRESREGVGGKGGGASKYLNGQMTRKCNWDVEIFFYFYDDDWDWCFKLKPQKSFEGNSEVFFSQKKWSEGLRRHECERVNKLQMQTRHAS